MSVAVLCSFSLMHCLDDILCGCSSMVEHKLPKLVTRVRFPSPAPFAWFRMIVVLVLLYLFPYLFIFF